MIENPNQILADAYIRHQIFLLRYSRGLSDQLWKLLQETERNIKLRLLDEDIEPGMAHTVSGSKRIDRLMKEIATIRKLGWENVDEKITQEMETLIPLEVEFTQNAMIAASPVVISPVVPSAIMLDSIINSRPFEGRLLSDWSKRMTEDDLGRISNQLRVGLVSGETNRQITSRLFGTAQMSFDDGIASQSRKQMAIITRTAIMHISGNARFQTALINNDIFEKEEFDATLDSRTTPVCRANDKKIFAIGTGPQPPLHIGCRSTRRPYFTEVSIGERPAKPTTEKILVKEYASKNNLPNVKSRSDLPRGHKGEFDQWARKRMREVIGPVSGDTSYQVWLKRQSDMFQDEVLGKTKAKLFRDGGLTLDKFINRLGDELTLKELALLEVEAFHKAGIDVTQFIKKGR